jgi:TIR domain
MTGIFISYRREDSGPYAGRLCDALVSHFGHDNVFFDVDTIAPGEDFREVIQQTCSSCKILLAVIGRQWATICDKNGKVRLDNKNDTLRIEIASALKNGLRIIPVLVGGAEMPDENLLPEDLQALVYRNALDVSDKRFHQDIQILVDTLKKTLDSIPKTTSASAIQKTEISSPSEKSRRMPKEKPKATAPSRKVPSTLSSRSKSSSPDSLPSLLPLYGVIPGRTTQSEIAKIGQRTETIDDETGEPYRCYKVKGVDCWCFKTEKIVDQIFLTDNRPMPEFWQKLGLQWKNSYDQWLSVLENLGYSLKVEEGPHIEQWEGHDSFSAEVIGRKEGLYPHKINLSFDYSRGTATDSPGTLFKITLDPLDEDGIEEETILNDDEEIEEENSLVDDEDNSSPDDSEPSLFPIFGIVLGKTSTKEIAKIGQRTETIDKNTGKPYLCYEANGVDFWYHGADVIGSMQLTKGLHPMPKPWQELGLRYEKSYDQWLSLLKGMGYSIEIAKKPRIEKYDGRDSFSAKVIARKEGRYPNEISLTFDYSRGTTTSSAGTLYGISITVIN